MKIRSIILTLIATVILAAGCDDSPTFSSDGRHTLSFSADTVSLDTVLTDLTSASRMFKVYNGNQAWLRFDTRLAGGTSSPFRVNIDGQGGISATGLELAPGDSIFCLVSANIPKSSAQQPFEVLDSVLFILEGGNVQTVCLRAKGQNAVLLRGATIGSDATFTAGLPYLVYDSLVVAPGATLTLEPGTRLLFHKDARLDVAGTLLATGTQENRVTMRGDRLDCMLENLPYDLLDGQWGGIRLRPESYGNSFIYCDIHSGSWGIAADSAACDSLKFRMENSILHNMTGDGICTVGCSIEVANSQITNAGGCCVRISGGRSSFTFCTIAGFSFWRQGECAVKLSDTFDGRAWPLLKATFNSCIITGRHERELVCELDTVRGCASDYSISHSLVLTTDSLDSHFSSVVLENSRMERYGAANFLSGTRRGYESVFGLDSLSAARGLADTAAVAVWPSDLTGVKRPAGASAGCYEFFEND